MRILVVEDDAQTAAYLLRGLSESGHVVDVAVSGPDGLALAWEGIHDALVVDRRLPGFDGVELVSRLRAGGSRTPVLMLSAQSSTEQRVQGLRAGCDDYLAKPYAFVEVLARLEGLLRAAAQGASGQTGTLRTLKVGELQLDTASRVATRQGRSITLQHRVATRQGRSITLQHREALLLEKLMRHSGEVVTRDMLLDTAWGYDFDPNDNVIDKHIHRLRRKLDEGFSQSLIRTVAGAGYSLLDK